MVNLKDAGITDYIRFVISTAILLFCTVVTLYAIVLQKTLFWDSVPGWAALILFFVDMFCLGVVEGLQIALVELKRQHADSYKKSHPRAYRIGQSAFHGDNVERFLMGRQVFVVLLVFFAAKLTTIYIEDGESFLFPAPWWFRTTLLESGMLGAIILVIIAQLMPQIVAAKYPVHFLDFIIMVPAYYICIGVEITGLTHACWLLSSLMQLCFKMKDDKTTINPVELVELEGQNEEDLENCVPPYVQNTDYADEVKQKVTERTAILSNDTPSPPKQRSRVTVYTDTENGNAELVHISKTMESLQQEVGADTLAAYRQYLDKHPEKFAKFPSVVGNKVYASPGEIAGQISASGCTVPRFLLDISDPNHVPPHIVACELLSLVNSLKEEVKDLTKIVDKINSS